MNSNNRKRNAILGVIVAAILWSLSFVWYKEILDLLSPISVITFRIFIAAIIITGFAKITGRLEKIKKQHFGFFLLAAFFEPFIYFICEVYGIKFTSATIGAIIISTIPLLTPFTAAVLANEKIERKCITGIFISMTGVITVILSGGIDSFSGSLIGVLLLFGAVAASIGYSVVIKKLTQSYGVFTIVSYQNVFGFLFLIPLFLMDPESHITASIFRWEVLKPILFLGLLCSGLAFVLYTHGIKILGMSTSALFLNLMPAITAIGSFVILKESLSIIKIGGILITITGLMFGTVGLNPKEWVKEYKRGAKYKKIIKDRSERQYNF